VTTQNKPVPARPAPPLVQRFILVTGASGGIGRATAARLADAGHLVFAAARRADTLQALAATHPGIRPVVLDITDQAAIDHARHQITDQTSGHGLDVLINAAGTLILGPVEAVSDPQTRAQFDVNLFGTLAVTRAFLPSMRDRGAGRIVNVASIMGRFALPGSGIYAASKFALEAASDALRIELAPFGVRVVVVEPGSSTPRCTSAPPPPCPTTRPLGPTGPAGRRGSGSPTGCSRPPRRSTPSPPPWPRRRWRPALGHATDLGCATASTPGC
jgi:NAD(P)-dependent dehydrogenase (short-subunit alcohol dehydrogenase family)